MRPGDRLLVIAGALAFGGGIGLLNVGCQCNSNAFDRQGGRYKARNFLVASHRVDMAPDGTLTETFERDGHRYRVLYTVRDKPRPGESDVGVGEARSNSIGGGAIILALPTFGDDSFEFVQE